MSWKALSVNEPPSCPSTVGTLSDMKATNDFGPFLAIIVIPVLYLQLSWILVKSAQEIYLEGIKMEVN